MKFIRKVEANPHTKVQAHWYQISKKEFEQIKSSNKALNSPSERFSKNITYWYSNFHLMKNESGNYFLVYFSSHQNLKPHHVFMLIEEFNKTGSVFLSEKHIKGQKLN